MGVDIDEYATALLEFLYDSPDEGVSSYLSTHSLDAETGGKLVTFLGNRGLVDDLTTHEGPDASINAEGVVAVQKIRRERMKPARRLGVLRSRMLTWLDGHDRQTGSRPWSEFLAGPDIGYYGNNFTEKEVLREADYLHERGLIKTLSTASRSPGVARSTITSNGRDCLVDFDGNVSEYLNRGQQSNTTTNIMMTGSTGNITVASDNVVQNVNAGLSTTEVLKFAGFVRQSLPVLGVEQSAHEALDAQAEELHQEASSAAPDRGRLRGLLDAVLDGLRMAAPTVVRSTAIGLGEKALKSVTGA
ncbi:hypothetical protein [Saccharothrix sp. Mg75]|uniref:hypothetical protein n=1 Tax=Saccharothrix sp. Mg75 TaxID=3445357 RepID=UPI003EEDF39B